MCNSFLNQTKSSLFVWDFEELHYLRTLLTSFVRWQMSRLVGDSVLVHPQSSSLIVTCQLHPTPSVDDRAFPVAAARAWNSLPDLVTSAPSVAVFRSRLKTHLFNISYPFSLWLYSACAVTLVALDTIIVLAFTSQVWTKQQTVDVCREQCKGGCSNAQEYEK